jgi:hypothetical protein
MKIVRIAALCGLLCVFAYAQTVDLGMGAFSSSEGAIDLVVDASLVNHKINSPYIMFMAYMGTQGELNIDVTRDTVVMVYNGQEYKMPSIQELRKNYNAQKNDINLYERLGQEAVILSQARFIQFMEGTDFFPVLGAQTTIPTSVATLSKTIGSRTKLYFKNPGLKKGDTLLIKVWGSNNPALKGEVEVILQ